jgi:hypothetical protein
MRLIHIFVLTVVVAAEDQGNQDEQRARTSACMNADCDDERRG